MEKLTMAELDTAWGEELPARCEMALLNLNLMIPINVGAALNVLTEGSTAAAFAGQELGVFQQ